MNKPLRNELFGVIILMISLISFIMVVGIVSIMIQKNNTRKIVVEYYEINAIHDLSYSLNKTISLAQKCLITNSPPVIAEYRKSLEKLHNGFDHCKNVITKRHSSKILSLLENALDNHIWLSEADFSEISDENRQATYRSMDSILYEIDNVMLTFQGETRDEIDEYIRIDKSISNASISFIAVIGLTIVVSSLFWGIRFVQKRTAPLTQLIEFTQKVGEGNLNLKSGIKFGNELDLLSDSFYKMVETLRETTISKDHFYNIINSIIDIIIVTDHEGRIKWLNSTTLRILGYESHELHGKNILTIFPDHRDDPDFLQAFSADAVDRNQNKEFVITSKDGNKIAVLISSSVLNKDQDGMISTIIVAHDITEKNKIEQQLEIERKEKIFAVFEAQEEERLRVARDLHDGLGQSLTGILYFIENNLKDKENTEGLNQKNISKLKLQIEAAIRDTKSIAHNIMPLLLKDFGLVAAVRKLAIQLNANHELSIKVNEFNFESRLDPKIEKTLYRVCQEALNNILKHAQARNVNIQMIRHEQSIVLLIDDDGIGFDPGKANLIRKDQGIGLASMKERVSSLNGTLTLTSEPNKGTEILIEIPI